METIKIVDTELIKLYFLSYKYTHPLYASSSKVYKTYFLSESRRDDYIAHKNLKKEAYENGHTLAIFHEGIFYPLNDCQIIN